VRLVVVQGPEAGGSWNLQAGENTAGREPENPIHLPSRRVSRRHCVFTVQDGRVFVRDLGSANGVVVEGRRVHEAELQDGQRLQLGDFLLALESPAAAAQPFAPQPVAAQPIAPQHQQQAQAQQPSWEQQPAAQQQGGWGEQPQVQPGGWGEQSAAQAPGGWGQQPQAEPQAEQAGWGQEAQPQGQSEPPAWDQQAQQGGWGQQSQGGYDEVGVDQGDAPDYSQSQATGTVTREIESGGFDAKVEQALAVVKQMPFPARLGIVIWAMVVVLLLSPIGGFLPLVEAANSRIETMAVERGIALAELVGYRNVTAIVDRKNALIDTRFLDGRTGVKFAMVTDSRGVVLSPPDKSGQTMEKEPAYIQAALEGGVGRSVQGELLVLMVPIKAVTREGAPVATVGYAYLLYDAKGTAATLGSLTLRASLSILLMIALGVALFFAIWRLAVVPVAQLREETELAVRGHQSKAVVKVPWRQLEELAHSINRAVQRMEGHAPGVESATAAAGPDPRVGSLMLASGFPVLLVDDGLRISELNAAAAYLLGVAEDGAVGSNVVDLLPDRDVGAKLRRMLDAIGAGQGTVFSDTAVLSGQERRVTVAGEPGGQGGTPRYAVVVIT
jgi:PAS domain-containing protein